MSNVYRVQQGDGVWTVYAGETPIMAFTSEAIALEFVKEAQTLVDKAREKDSSNVLPWRPRY